MELSIDYYVKRKSDNKLLTILHEKLSENDILDLIREKVESERPWKYPKEEYEFVDFGIDEIKIN